MSNVPQYKPKKKVTKQLSLAVSVLFVMSLIVTGLGNTWGFSKLALQIADTFVNIGTPIEVVFLGKYFADKEKEDEDKN